MRLLLFMGPLSISQYIISGIFLTVGLLHLAIYLRRKAKPTDLYFALMCLFAAGGSVLEGLTYTVTAVPRYSSLYKIQVAFQGGIWLMMVWFIASLTATARPLIRNLATIGYAVAIMANLIAPFGVLFERIDRLNSVLLPWGERVFYATGPANAWRVIADVSWLLMIYLMVESCIRLYRRGDRQKAVFIGGSLFLCLGPAYVHGTLVDIGVTTPPFWDNYSLLALVLIMSSVMVGQVIKTSLLQRSSAELERRWHALIENVSLLAVGVGNDGLINFANPCFCEVSGYDNAAIQGRPLLDIFPESERELVRKSFREAIGGHIKPQVIRPLLTRDGGIRLVQWFHVLLRNSNDGTVLGTMSIGEDITELKAAEAARDSHLAELEVLKEKLQRENIYLKAEIQADHGFAEIIGQSNALLYVLAKVQQVAETDTTVLIQGETGVGKELVARAIHDAGQRTDGPFVRVDCTAIPADLVESELFGHEAGAFTGATRQRLGRFELAKGGTVFLDEVSELPQAAQAKLLRVLEELEFERVGGNRTLAADVRIIAATNRNLTDDVAGGRFRADLYYRLNVYPLSVPPLRRRTGDIPLLVNHFIKKFNQQMGKAIAQVPALVMEQLTAYDWPGNVRELRNVIERAVITSDSPVLSVPELMGPVVPCDSGGQGDADALVPLESVERNHIRKVLDGTGWRISGPNGAAAILGLNPSTLRFRMKKLGIQKE